MFGISKTKLKENSSIRIWIEVIGFFKSSDPSFLRILSMISGYLVTNLR